MSKKNKRQFGKKPSIYPLPERTVHYSHKTSLQPVPEIGKKYHCFDDGKITFSRHYIIKVDEVLNHMEFKRKYPELFQRYIKEARNHYWLFSRRTDKFIVTYSGENGETEVFVRTKQGGWFSIGSLFNSGKLDVTSRLWEYLVSNIDNFDYSAEEKEQLIRENTI